jgi:hypothetical protein
MRCYFQGCREMGTTKEHIPPRSFFPVGEKEQLLTVKSCTAHNNAKSKDDLYVLAQICMHASPSNRAREVWLSKVVPQLDFNGGKLRSMLAKGAVPHGNGVAYPVQRDRLDGFFTALSCGLVFKSQQASLPAIYAINHVYHSLVNSADATTKAIEAAIEEFYKGKPMTFMEFGKPDLQNERIYTAEIHGLPNFESSITIVHLFFGKFKVTSMLSRLVQPPY